MKRKRKSLKGGNGGGEREREKVAGENKNERSYLRNEDSQVHGAFVIQYKKVEIHFKIHPFEQNLYHTLNQLLTTTGSPHFLMHKKTQDFQEPARLELGCLDGKVLIWYPGKGRKYSLQSGSL